MTGGKDNNQHQYSLLHGLVCFVAKECGEDKEELNDTAILIRITSLAGGMKVQKYVLLVYCED